MGPGPREGPWMEVSLATLWEALLGPLDIQWPHSQDALKICQVPRTQDGLGPVPHVVPWT